MTQNGTICRAGNALPTMFLKSCDRKCSKMGQLGGGDSRLEIQKPLSVKAFRIYPYLAHILLLVCGQ
jgi:hypothetical protein